MTSFDYRLNPLYTIKECSSCGALYTTDYCCSDGSIVDKIICDLNKTPDFFQEPPQNCPKCGNPVDGQYCQGCALLRKELKEVWFIIYEENGILQGLLDTSESSNDNTNSCGKGAHIGYNCPPKVSIIPNPKPCNNKTFDELSQTLPSFDPTCYPGDENSFTYDSKSNIVDDSPNVFNPPLQPPTYSYEFCGNDAYYGHDCPLQVPFTYDPEPLEERAANINTQPFQYSVIHQPPQEEISVEFLQEKRKQINSVQTFLRKFNRISFYKMPMVLSLAWETILEIELAFEDKHCQPEDILELFRRLHNYVQNIYEELSVYINTPSWDRPMICYNNDDDEDCTIAIIPILSTKEPDNSLSMGDEHLDTILATKSDELIMSSVENLVPIPSESEGIPDNMCDVPFRDNSPSLDISKDQFEDFSDSNDDYTSIDDNSFSIDDIEIDEDILLTIKDDILRKKLLNINLFIAKIKALKDNPTPFSNFMTKSSSTSLKFLLEETNTFDNSLPESETFCFDSEENSSDSTTTRADISLPDYKAFYDNHVKEISSDSTTTHFDFSLYDSFIFDLSINPFPPADRSYFYKFADELAHIISPPEYDCFSFKNEPNSRDFTMDVVEDTFPIREPRVHVHNVLLTHPNLQLNLDFILSSSESLFAYVVWIFLPFLSYSVAL
uniref:Pre-mRNA splicing Prp18-interacting factor n=1 Tax=Tanacetum cinerariifolium TaxID=118510 RepID=A0A6L2NVY3_TANCI|nr:hypothetical protein [Tanacetum cinerariifolium]